MKLAYWVIGLLVYWFIFPLTASAASLSLSVDPPIVEINTLSPSITKTDLSIQNKSNTQVAAQIQIKPFKARGENGELEFLKDSMMLKNIQVLDNGVPVENITLAPSQQKNLTLSISIPDNISVSDYYFSILFLSQNISNPTSTSSLNQLGIASNVLLSVGPKETPNATLEEFSAKPFYAKGPVLFEIRLKNKGTHFIKPKGEVLIKNMFGQSVGKLDMFPVNILSGSIRGIPNDLYIKELISQGDSESKAQSALDFQHPIVLWKEGFLLGLYTATLNISLSDDGPAFTKSIRFLAFPIQGLIVITIISIAGIIIRNKLKTRTAI